ncbi:hypothetical protein SPD48_09490 [Pseudogracilibacillus sp. SE30717A]|uniref:hypothetical protein n=1 Tax=Pseudogracilibacillus sp. SE30717A TaxID=3098293 RepID=UPI00300DEEBE
MKIAKITLKEMEVREENGEYKQHFFNEKTYPIFLTNYALKRGKEQGYIETSLFSELAKMVEMEKAKKDDGELDVSQLSGFDEEKAIQIIYLGLKGANKGLELPYDDFLEQYHYDIESTLELYAELITNLVSSNPNQFANEFKKVTSNDKKKW